MTDSVTAEQAPNELPALQHSTMDVELIMDSYRVSGELQSVGVPRRLVDFLNSVDGNFIIIHGGDLDDPLVEDEPRHFEQIQVHMNTLLLAIPRSASQVHPDAFEIIQKVPVPTTIAVPGFEITGNVFLMPQIDPAGSQLLGSRHFVPVTDATVASATNHECVWHEPAVVVNLARALVFAPR
ncbi:MAG: hypothetical protein WD904_00820 [Dehalococcoidia bacterium]